MNRGRRDKLSRLRLGVLAPLSGGTAAGKPPELSGSMCEIEYLSVGFLSAKKHLFRFGTR